MDGDLIQIENHFAAGEDRTAVYLLQYHNLIQQRRIADALEKLADCTGVVSIDFQDGSVFDVRIFDR